MPVRRRTTRKAPVRRRRRRSMGQKVTAAKVNAATMTAVKAGLGGVIASALTNTLGNQVSPGFAPYTGLAGSIATSLFFKQPEIAAGMAGYAGPKVLSSLPGVGGFLAGGGAYSGVADNMYLQEGASSDVYASNYTLAGYDIPGL
ncbi:MAG: hypothetical protein EBT51_08705 [Flavobacteriaceae bacterium]|nr:hypothetical protein [Flavobacteriaceae bacterium]